MTDQEIIRVVAEKVMEFISDDHRSLWIYDYNNKRELFKKDDWHPLTDLNHAFMVVEKMREDGYEYEITTDLTQWNYEYEKKKVAVVFYNLNRMMENKVDYETAPDSFFHKSCQESVCKAICLAALKAEGVE